MWVYTPHSIFNSIIEWNDRNVNLSKVKIIEIFTSFLFMSQKQISIEDANKILRSINNIEAIQNGQSQLSPPQVYLVIIRRIF